MAKYDKVIFHVNNTQNRILVRDRNQIVIAISNLQDIIRKLAPDHQIFDDEKIFDPNDHDQISTLEYRDK